MSELLTAAQMRAIESNAIGSGEVTGLELMERAGRGVVEAVLAEWPELATTSRRAIVLCGPGNNGGDGFVVARLLSRRGWQVSLWLHGDASRLPPDARANFDRWAELGPVGALTAGALEREIDFGACDLAVDALFGTGLARPVELPLSALSAAARSVAVDLPSGICSDSGRMIGDEEGVAEADLTVTFHLPKLGHYLGSGPRTCGRLVVADIGLGPARLRCRTGRHRAGAETAEATLQRPVCLSRAAQALAKDADEHKYAHGHALVIAGPAGRGGAARLAARGALRIGAGLVTLGVPAAAVTEHAARLDAVMLSEIDGAGELMTRLRDVRLNALCLGPGLGALRAEALLPTALAARRPIVLDADAVTHLSGLDAPFRQLHRGCVLTPHAGEFARLFPDLAARLSEPASRGPAYSKVDATREAAARAGCVVLFKGPVTVIADPSGRASINAAVHGRQAPWLATAGSGDVLAGFIAGLLARGFDPMAAAETAAWLHVEAARSFGAGLIAEDLPDELPKVLRGLGF